MICIQSLDHTVLLRNSNKLNQDDWRSRNNEKSYLQPLRRCDLKNCKKNE